MKVNACLPMLGKSLSRKHYVDRVSGSGERHKTAEDFASRVVIAYIFVNM